MKIMIYRFKMSIHIPNRYLIYLRGCLGGQCSGTGEEMRGPLALGTCSSLPRTGTRSPPPPPLQHQPASFLIISFHLSDQ